MVSKAELANLKILMLGLLISILSSASCKVNSTNSDAEKLSETANFKVVYRVKVVPAGGRLFAFEVIGKNPNKIEFKGQEIIFECLDEECRFNIAGEPDEPIENAGSAPHFQSGDSLTLYFDQQNITVLPIQITEPQDSSDTY